jgi:hypothetical protein
VSVQWWVGRCRDCGAVRALDVQDPKSLQGNPQITVSLEDAPVAFTDHTCEAYKPRPRQLKLHWPRRVRT